MLSSRTSAGASTISGPMCVRPSVSPMPSPNWPSLSDTRRRWIAPSRQEFSQCNSPVSRKTEDQSPEKLLQILRAGHWSASDRAKAASQRGSFTGGSYPPTCRAMSMGASTVESEGPLRGGSPRCPGAAAPTSALTPWTGEPLARGFARQDANYLVGLGPSEDAALGVMNPRPGFGRTDHGCRMTLGEEGVQGRLGPVRREGREQSARGEGGPGVGAEDPAQGGPGSEPEDGSPVDPEEDARGMGHLVQARGEATLGRVVKGRRPQLSGQERRLHHRDPGIVQGAAGRIQEGRVEPAETVGRLAGQDGRPFDGSRPHLEHDVS